MDASSPRKLLKIYNLRTTNAMKMKLGTIVCVFMRPFILQKIWALPLGSISWYFPDYIKNHNICYTLPWTASLVRILYKSDMIWGCNLRKATQKPPFSWYENLWKFITWEPQTLWRWNLAGLCISMRPFICPKIGAFPIRTNRVWSKNLWKQATKWGFWVIFLAFSALYQKPQHIWYKILFCITVPNLETIWLHLGELWAKNHPKAPPKWHF